MYFHFIYGTYFHLAIWGFFCKRGGKCVYRPHLSEFVYNWRDTKRDPSSLTNTWWGVIWKQNFYFPCFVPIIEIIFHCYVGTYLSSVSDASGRYSSQFHFGNGFWLGSSTLCKELNVTDRESATNEEQPPFPLRFHVARLYLTFPKEVDFSVSFFSKVTSTFIIKHAYRYFYTVIIIEIVILSLIYFIIVLYKWSHKLYAKINRFYRATPHFVNYSIYPARISLFQENAYIVRLYVHELQDELIKCPLTLCMNRQNCHVILCDDPSIRLFTEHVFLYIHVYHWITIIL